MAISPEQQRKKAIAQDESLRHARYAQADGSMKQANTAPMQSAAINAAENRVRAATGKETASMGEKDPSPNAIIRF